MSITSQQAMTILYPMLAVLTFGYFVFKIVFWYTTRRSKVAFIDSIFFLLESIVTGMLTLLTGAHPWFDIEDYRPLVVVVRFLMALCLILCIKFTRDMISAQGVKR